MLGSVVVVGVVLLLSVFTSALLNVHVIPHSHCDAGERCRLERIFCRYLVNWSRAVRWIGWLITEEQYYSLEVDEILTSITDTLQQNPNARFNWAEVPSLLFLKALLLLPYLIQTVMVALTIV